jgi:hypothetical protein
MVIRPMKLSDVASIQVQAQMPALRPWPTMTLYNHNPSSFIQQSLFHGLDGTEPDHNFITTLHARTAYPDPLTIGPASQSYHRQMSENNSESTQDFVSLGAASNEDHEMGNADGEDATSLKGVMWPGMGLFDSASDEMKRKRNQRKDGSILEQMELTSATVEPTEVIYSPTGEIKKQRHISGMVEISSPLKGETPLVNKRTKRTKQGILAAGNPNVRAGAKRRGRKPTNAVDDDHNLQQLSRQALPFLVSSSPVRKLRRTDRFKPTDDDDAEFRLTVGDFAEKKGHGLKIFTDDSRSYQDNDKRFSVARNGPTTNHASNSGNHPHGQTYVGLLNPQMLHRPHTIATSESTMPSMYTTQSHQNVALFGMGEGKENMEPLMSHYVRFEPSNLSGERIRQRYFTQEYGQPPKFYSLINPDGGFPGFGFPPANPLGFNQPDIPCALQLDDHKPTPSRGTDLTKSEYDVFYLGEVEE